MNNMNRNTNTLKDLASARKAVSFVTDEQIVEGFHRAALSHVRRLVKEVARELSLATGKPNYGLLAAAAAALFVDCVDDVAREFPQIFRVVEHDCADHHPCERVLVAGDVEVPAILRAAKDQVLREEEEAIR